MPNLKMQFHYGLARINALIPLGENAKDYLAHHLDLQIEYLSADTPMGIVPSSILSKTQMLASARIAAELIDQPDKLVGKPEGIIDLGLIEWLLRPAIPVREGLLGPIASGPWQSIPTNTVEKEEKLVCRLDIVIAGYSPIHLGTGFIVGKDADERSIIMTNAHVVEEAVRHGWTKSAMVEFGCDFTRYSAESAQRLAFVASEYRLHPKYDLALVYLHADDGRGLPLGSLTLSEEPPGPTVGIQIGVLGHPSFDSSLDPFPKYFGFGDEFGIKRFSPGEIRVVENRNWRGSDVEAILHDATTLSGSSGSCIFDLTNMKVIGLHFGGWPLPPRSIKIDGTDVLAQLFHVNGAVPLWRLRQDSLLQEITFQ